MFKVGIVVASDKCSTGERQDKSGKLIQDTMIENGYEVVKKTILPDEELILLEELIYMSDELKIDLILTTGGTGFSPRDVMPEATIRACDRMANGIAEAIRSYSLNITPRAMLSRAVSGIRNKTLIINLPGSPKAMEETLHYVLESVKHGLEILTGRDSECARE